MLGSTRHEQNFATLSEDGYGDAHDSGRAPVLFRFRHSAEVMTSVIGVETVEVRDAWMRSGERTSGGLARQRL